MELSNKWAYITGAGGGIGRATAVALADEGVNVLLLGGRNEDKAKETQKLVQEYGVKCYYVLGDLCQDEVLFACFDRAIEITKGVDILINNAGMAQNNPFLDTDVELFDKIMSINARVPFILTQKALPYIKKSDYATIINIASVTSHLGYKNQSAYSASKHALLGFTKALAGEVYDEGVRVHAISPGGVYTDMVKISRPDLTADGMIMPEEIANIVIFLLKNRGNAVIDEIIVHRAKKQPFLV